MEKNYDGWVVKTKEGRLLMWSFSDTRTEIVQDKAGEKWWRSNRKNGCKIVKAKLIEVE